MASAGSIFVDLLLRDARYTEGLNRARRATRNATNEWQRDLGRAGQSFSNLTSPVNALTASLRQMVGIVAGALSVQKVIAYSDSWKSLESRLNLVTGSMEATRQAQERLFNISQNNAQPLNETISAYVRLSNSVNENQKSQYDLIRISELLSKTLVLSGTNAAGAATFFQQFGQAASSDFKAIGQELQTFVDQNPVFYGILKDEAAKYGKTLKDLAEDGELSFDLVADAVLAAGDRIDGQASTIALTVGRALTQLDNAFLKYIGQSEAAASGTNSLALAISALAQNLDLVADALVLVAGVFAGRLVGSLTATLTAWVLNTRQVLLYQAALARMAGVATTTAGALVGLSGAATIAGRAFAILGGPVGAITLAAIAISTFGDESSETSFTQLKYNAALTEAQRVSLLMATATEAETVALKEKRQALLDAAQAEVVATRAEFQRIAALADKEAAGGSVAGAVPFVRLFSNSFKAEQAAKEMKAATLAYKELEQTFAEQEASVERIRKITSGGGGGGAVASSQNKQIENQQKINTIYEKYKTIISGIDQATLDYNKSLEEINLLYQAGKISTEELTRAQQTLMEEYSEVKDVSESTFFDMAEFAKSASQNVQSAFADFLFNPFEGGVKGMLSSFIDVVRRMVAEATAAKLAENLFGGSSGGGGFLSTILGSVGAGLSSFAGGTGYGTGVDVYNSVNNPANIGFFAEGGYLEPGEWGVAGEREAELIYGGRTGMTVIPPGKMGAGGNTYQIDARGADQGAVSRIEQALIAYAGPGVIEQRVLNAQQRGSL